MSQSAFAPSTNRPSSDWPVDLDHELARGFAHKFIRYKTRQLVGRCGFTRSDRSDLDQELKLRLFERCAQFDPARSDWPVFVTTVVERQIASLLESRQRLKRFGDGNAVSLSQEAADEDGATVELSDRVTIDHLQAVTREFERSDHERTELEIDLQHVLSELSPEERRICEALKHGNIAQVARRLQIPRTTISSLMGRLRRHCREQRLQDFF